MLCSKPFFFFFLCFILLLLHPYLTASQEQDDESGFDYNECSPIGPSNWGDLSDNWIICNNGTHQSPIDVNYWNYQVNPLLKRLMTRYNMANSVIKNRGHDIMVKWTGHNAGDLRIDDKSYLLIQCHWHAPSEHTLNGIRYPLEMHMVHLSNDNEIAVIGIFYKLGQPDPFITKLTWWLKELAFGTKELPIGKIQPPELREATPYFRYQGSLTTPPCTEGVIWTLLQEVRNVSLDQLELLRAPVHWQDNARPIHKLNGRRVYLYQPPHPLSESS